MDRVTIQSAIFWGILVTAMKWPRTVEPAISMRIIPAVLRAPSFDAMYFLKVISRLTTARRRRANVPTLPASEGVKTPAMIPPTAIRKTVSTHTISGNERSRAFQVDRSDLGATLGSILAHP